MSKPTVEKADAVERIKEQARQKEVEHSERVATMQQTHQKDILTLQDQLLKERKAAEDNMKRMMDEINRGTRPTWTSNRRNMRSGSASCKTNKTRRSGA